MKTYEFTGDRGDYQGRTLAKGDRMELSSDDAEYLLIGQAFPIKETVETKDEVIEHVSI